MDMAQRGAESIASDLSDTPPPPPLPPIERTAPLAIDIEDIVRDAISLRSKIGDVLWDTPFENQFGDELDGMLSDINGVIAHCAPLIGWARVTELNADNTK